MKTNLTREYLYKKYTDERLSVREIAAQCGVSHTTVHRALIFHNIQTRHREKARMLRIQKRKREERKKEVLSYFKDEPPVDWDFLEDVLAECQALDSEA